MATGYPETECKRETLREQLQRRLEGTQKELDKLTKLVAFLDAHPEFEEFQNLMDAARY